MLLTQVALSLLAVTYVTAFPQPAQIKQPVYCSSTRTTNCIDPPMDKREPAATQTTSASSTPSSTLRPDGAQCQGSQYCQTFCNTQGICGKQPLGGKCYANSNDCPTGSSCINGACATSLQPVGAGCLATSDCTSGSSCISNTCTVTGVAMGGTCNANVNCKNGLCINGKCSPAPDGTQGCQNGLICPSGLCGGSVCYSKRPDGGKCDGSQTYGIGGSQACQNSNCNTMLVCGKQPIGGACQVTSIDCPSGTTCDGGRCVLPLNAPCQSSDQCSDYCTEGFCDYCPYGGDYCD